MNSIKVLLIEDNRLEAHQVKQWLARSVDVSFEVEWEASVALALTRLDRGGIDIILSDLNLPDSRGMETFVRVHDRAPNVPIVMHTSVDDEAIGAQAVERGAQDYLVKQQVDAPRLARVLRFALSRHQAKADQIHQSNRTSSARIIGFMGAKGGVGTTTAAINLAAVLAEQRKSVIVAELRSSFGSLARSLNHEPPGGVWSLLDLAPERIGERELKAHLFKGPAGLRLLYGPQQVEQYREIEARQAEAMVRGLARMADFVILDLPGYPSTASEAAAGLCHYIALVTERDAISTCCAKAVLDQLYSWSVNRNDVGAIVVNRAELPMALPISEIRSRLECEVVGVVPQAAAACMRALQEGKPLVISQPDHTASFAFGELAEKIAAEDVAVMSF